MILQEVDTIPRPDLRVHVELQDDKPGPIGILDSCVYQYKGTKCFQWWKKLHSCDWKPTGNVHYLRTVKNV